MQIYYLNSKGLKYISQICGESVEKIKELNENNNNNYVYVPNKKSGVSLICNFNKDLLVKVDLDDDINNLKKMYNLKNNVEVGDMFIVNQNEKYVVKPLDTMDKIAEKLGVNKDYIMNKNNLKTDKVFIGQILII